MSDVSISYRVPRAPVEAFDDLVRHLVDGLGRRGVSFEAKPQGRLRWAGTEVAVVARWNPGDELALRWIAMPWGRSGEATVRFRFSPEAGGCRVTCELEEGAGLLGESDATFADWIEADLLASALGRLLPDAVGDWVTDRRARRPAGSAAREVYREPLYHLPNFELLLERLRLTSSDRLLEVGCGGGAFLARALRSGCTAVGVDHSPEMIDLAGQTNLEAVRAGRLRLVVGDAGRLPVDDRAFSCCLSTGAFGFFPDPRRALEEMYRALVPGGRLAIFASTPSLRGTPAAPEPVASRVRFYEGPELLALARSAGFRDARVEHPQLETYARSAGLPDDAIEMFRGDTGAVLLTATKPPGGSSGSDGG